ncbi:hypothetical protein CEXT_697901, partial [Caerostris extrusa]
SFCLRLKYLKIPYIYPSGHDAVLTCDFDMEGETLYAVKWFHNGKSSTDAASNKYLCRSERSSDVDHEVVQMRSHSEYLSADDYCRSIYECRR